MSDNFGFGNQNIEINSVPKNSNKNNISNPKIDNSNVIPMNNQNKDDNLIENKKEREVVVINPYKDKLQTSLEAINKTWIDKFFCCFAIFKKYFQITSQDFLLRFLNSLIPFNNKFQNLVKDKPDLYGPIWIYSSLIIIISATGSLTRTFQGNNNKNFFQEFVPIAGVVIYGVGFGLPILIAFLMKIFGTSLTFASVICTYGYSFSIFLPISIICVIQWDILQWISLIYAIFSSTSLLVVNYYKQMGDYSKNKKFLIIIIVLIFQFGLLLFFKLYFFQRFSQEVMSENNENINNGTILYNNTNEMTNIINEAINYNNTNIAKNNSDAITNNSFDLGSNI
jgi:hypothetical protein